MSVKKKTKTGRPKKFILTATDYKTIERAYSLGLTDEDICCLIGWNEKTYQREKQGNERVLSAYKKGIKDKIMFATEKLHDNIKLGKEASIFFFLKTKGGYREKDYEPESPNSITIKLPKQFAD